MRKRRCPNAHIHAERKCPECLKAKNKRYDRGSRSKESHRFYNTAKWKRTRLAVLKRDHYLCKIDDCGTPVGKSGDVDHIKPRLQYPELAYDMDNLQTACDPCHARKTRRGE